MSKLTVTLLYYSRWLLSNCGNRFTIHLVETLEVQAQPPAPADTTRSKFKLCLSVHLAVNGCYIVFIWSFFFICVGCCCPMNATWKAFPSGPWCLIFSQSHSTLLPATVKKKTTVSRDQRNAGWYPYQCIRLVLFFTDIHIKKIITKLIYCFALIKIIEILFIILNEKVFHIEQFTLVAI